MIWIEGVAIYHLLPVFAYALGAAKTWHVLTKEGDDDDPEFAGPRGRSIAVLITLFWPFVFLFALGIHVVRRVRGR